VPIALGLDRRSGSETRSLGLSENLDAATVSAPATGHRLHTVRNDLGLFDTEFAAHAVMVKRSNGRCFDDVKSSQISARVAAIPVSHGLTVAGSRGLFVPTTLPLVRKDLVGRRVGILICIDRVVGIGLEIGGVSLRVD
jgi:hypothetical protein